MKTAYPLLVAAVAATASLAASATPSSTDEARVEAAQHTAAGERGARLRSFVPVDTEVVSVTDTDSARAAAGQEDREEALRADYADYLQIQAKAR